jgi:hypothetical protein
MRGSGGRWPWWDVGRGCAAGWRCGLAALCILAAAALLFGSMHAAPAAQSPPLPDVWRTDFSRQLVGLHEFQLGGPPRDGIPAIDRPQFESVAAASAWLRDREPVILLALAGEVRAYPLQILVWHEIVNDVVGDTPVVVTFCPLCNTAVVFDARLDSQRYTFGTTGLLRHSNLVMYDRETESWWQQATGEALVGTLAGRRLAPLPAQLVSWRAVREGYPETRVLSRATGYRRDYGRNPYPGLDDVERPPFLLRGVVDGRLAPMERVVTVQRGNEAVAYPYFVLRQVRVVNHTVGGVAGGGLLAGGERLPLLRRRCGADRRVPAGGRGAAADVRRRGRWVPGPRDGVAVGPLWPRDRGAPGWEAVGAG